MYKLYIRTLFVVSLSLLVLFTSCREDVVEPDVPITPTPLVPVVPADTVPEQPEPVDTIPEIPDVPDPPITFSFVLSATLGDYMTWDIDDSLFVHSSLDDQDIDLILYVDSISEDNKTAWFTEILSFEPSDDMQWSVSRPAICDNFSIQDGTEESLYEFISLSDICYGKSPQVNFCNNIRVLRLTLPEDIETVECVGGFETLISLSTPSSINDQVYLVMPDTCTNLPNVVLRKEDGRVVRSRKITMDDLNQEAIASLVDISLVNHQRISVEAGSPYDTFLRGNFSGITWMGGNRYAIVDDDDIAAGEGWYLFDIDISKDGKITNIEKNEFVNSGLPNRDLEGITYNPTTRKMWLSGEKDNVISEHRLSGERTGRVLDTSMFDKACENAGLESLAYNDIAKQYWTTTEAGMRGDGAMATPLGTKRKYNKLRFQSYKVDGTIGQQFFYETDDYQKNEYGDQYSFGVSALTALDDGRLLVLERECQLSFVENGEIGFCYEKLFLVDPTVYKDGDKLSKELLLELSTSLSASKKTNSIKGEFTNYEGMCLGPYLSEDTRMLFLVSDSRANQSIAYSLDSKPYSFPDVFLPIVLKFEDE